MYYLIKQQWWNVSICVFCRSLLLETLIVKSEDESPSGSCKNDDLQHRLPWWCTVLFSQASQSLSPESRIITTDPVGGTVPRGSASLSWLPRWSPLVVTVSNISLVLYLPNSDVFKLYFLCYVTHIHTIQNKTGNKSDHSTFDYFTL